MRGADGDNVRSPTSARLGREKKPSVITADSPSSISSVVTPAQVTVSGAPSGRGRRVEVAGVVGQVRPAELEAHSASLWGQNTGLGTSTTRQPSGSSKVSAPTPAQYGFSASTGSWPAAASLSMTAYICASLRK